MELNFITEPSQTPQPKEDIRIESLTVTPYPDRKRYRVDINITPFAPRDRPSLTITATSQPKYPLPSAEIVETMRNTLSITLHGKEEIPSGTLLTFYATLYYDIENPQHLLETAISV